MSPEWSGIVTLVPVCDCLGDSNGHTQLSAGSMPAAKHLKRVPCSRQHSTIFPAQTLRDFYDLGNSLQRLFILWPILANHYPSRATSVEAYVLEVDRLRVDAAFGGRDPAGHFAAFENAVHYAVHVCAII